MFEWIAFSSPTKRSGALNFSIIGNTTTKNNNVKVRSRENIKVKGTHEVLNFFSNGDTWKTERICS
jgi:hypothetical protein